MMMVSSFGAVRRAEKRYLGGQFSEKALPDVTSHEFEVHQRNCRILSQNGFFGFFHVTWQVQVILDQWLSIIQKEFTTILSSLTFLSSFSEMIFWCLILMPSLICLLPYHSVRKATCLLLIKFCFLFFKILNKTAVSIFKQISSVVALLFSW